MSKLPAITIEREYGAGGGAIARRLAQLLHIPCYGKDLLEEASALAGITPREAYQLEARESGKINRLISGAFQLLPGIDAEEDYVHDLQAELIRSRAQAQPAVFVGRLAQDALKETGLDYVRILIVRPLKDRIHQVAKLKNVSKEQAERLIKQVDANREGRVRRHGNRPWKEASQYDLVLNSQELGVDGSVMVIQEFLEQREKRHKMRNS